ncbi:MAG: MarR family transcriptional regulator [Gammaproteobacteria bacterium]|nr:MarR family transcriptional regulator [Gammaproteobacteria bacterium]
MHHTRKGRIFTEIILDVFKLEGLLIAEGDELTSELGITSARWKVLGALARSDKPLTVPQIAYSMGQSRQSVQRLTDVMEKLGMLLYQVNPHHKKAKLVALSTKGRELYELAEQKQIPWANLNSAEINVPDLEMTLSVLRRIIQKFAP